MGKYESSRNTNRVNPCLLLILGPTEDTSRIGNLLNGMLINDDQMIDPANSKIVAGSTRCTTDRFHVTNPGGLPPPTICGQNTGEHSKFRHLCPIIIIISLNGNVFRILN